MRRNSNRGREAGRRRAGWSLIEVLVALAVISIFLVGVMGAFIQILRTTNRSERMIEAYENARAAVETIAIAVKAARTDPRVPNPLFRGINVPTFSGDHADNDKDGRVDEETPNGFDDDHDWVESRDDRHADLQVRRERPRFVGRPDLGDGHVDEDCVFNNDQLAFIIFPDPNIPGSSIEVTSFSIGVWEGESNVLRQEVQRNFGGGGVPETAPLAFNVVSVNYLFWDVNRDSPYWAEEWDASTPPPRPPGIVLPAAVYISVTVYAGQKPLDQVGPDEPMETMTASTVVDLESVLHDPRYESVRARQ